MPEPRDHMPAALGRGHLQASDADREQVIGVLKAAFVQGRLGKDELTARVGQALAARTYADLAALTADLPAGLAAAEPPYQPAGARAPRPVRTAVWLMWLGAVLTLADAATVLVTLGGVRSAAVQDVDFTGGRWHIFMLIVIVPALASAPIAAGVWLWLAWANGWGYAWARFAFMALAGVLTIGWLFVLGAGTGEDAAPYTSRDLLATTALWLVGLVAMVLIFSETASPYYQRRAANASSNTREGNRTLANWHSSEGSGVVMRFCRRGMILIGLAVAGFAPTALTAPPAAAGQAVARVASHCIKVIATIPLSKASGGIAVNPKTDTVYVPNGGHKVIVIRGQTNKVVSIISVGRNADSVAVNPATNTIYVDNSRDGTISVINGQTKTVVATIPLGRDESQIAVNPATNTIYVPHLFANTVSVISGRTNTVTATIPVAQFPQSIVADPKTNTIYVTGMAPDEVTVISGQTDKVVAHIPFPQGSPRALAVNPATDTVYAVWGFNDMGTASVISGQTNTVVANIPVGDIPDAVAVNPSTNIIYVANQFVPTSLKGSVSVLNGQTNKALATISVGVAPAGVAADPVTNRAYVANAPTQGSPSSVSVLGPCQQ
jgi:YVTN family beta-propeller protein